MSKSKVKRLRDEVEQLNRDRGQVMKWLEEARNENRALMRDIEKLSERADKANREVQLLKNHNTRGEAKIRGLMAEIDFWQVLFFDERRIRERVESELESAAAEEIPF